MRIFESRYAIHTCFCTAFALLFGVLILLNGNPAKIAVNGVLICLFDLLCIYTGRWCTGKWLMDNKFLQFFVYTCAAVIFLSLLGAAGSIFLNVGVIRPFRLYLTISAPLAGIMVLLGIFLTITRTTIIQKIHTAEIAQQQKAGELNLLLAQLSPHFLFNTLNNLYGISITQQGKIPDLLLKLSSLLRYSIYDVRQAFVPLRDELGYILNYIDFEKIRLGDRVSVNETLAFVECGSCSIAPMVLITFVENAFKHSKRSIRRDIEININLEIANDLICFSITNTLGNEKEENGLIHERSGIGLSTTLKRLELLYGQEHSIEQYVENEYYHVKLRLKAK